ncbi:uncharacterized protein [Antedon mediterranea]|uniref:uncharacterized protein n=1 Tax=Antedon mediterranea TaxID=105859 RepID=UPI003AF71CD9
MTSKDDTTEVSDEVSYFGSCKEDEYFELRIPENIVELQQKQTLSNQDLHEFGRLQVNIENLKVEVLRCKLCKYRCIFREEIIHHMKNVHIVEKEDVSSIAATVVDVLMKGLSSEAQKSQNYLELNTVNPENTASDSNSEVNSVNSVDQDFNESITSVTNTSTQQNTEHTCSNEPSDNIVLQDVVADLVVQEMNIEHDGQKSCHSSAKAVDSSVTINCQTSPMSIQSGTQGFNPILHSKVDLSAIAKSAAACNPKATKITVFQHVIDSETPTAIHFRKSRKSDAIIPTNDSLGILSPFLNKEYRGQKHFACAQCHARYKTENELTTHVDKKHNRGESVLCEICGLEFASQSSAKYHASRMHTPQCELLKCDKCDYETRFEKRLEIHRARHESDFFCNVCKKSYVSNQKLERHFQSPLHKNFVNPLICEHCGYSSKKKDNFLVHMRKHTGEKPYKCNHCPYASADGSTLKKHVMAKHSNIRPFKCQWCSFSSVDKKGLTVHIRKHTGERPFQCSHCNYAAKRRSALKIHMETHIHGTDKKSASTNDPMKILNKILQTEATQVEPKGPRQQRKSLPSKHKQIQSGKQNQVVSLQSPITTLQNQVPNSAIMQNQAPNPGVMMVQATSTGAIQSQPLITGVMQNQVPRTGVLQNQTPMAGVLQTQAPNAGVVQGQLSIAGVMQNQAPRTGVLQNQTPMAGVLQTQAHNAGVVQGQLSIAGVMQNQAPRTGVLQTQAPNAGVVQGQLSIAGVMQNQAPRTGVLQKQAPNAGVAQGQLSITGVMQNQAPRTGVLQKQAPNAGVAQGQQPITSVVHIQAPSAGGIQAHTPSTGIVESQPLGANVVQNQASHPDVIKDQIPSAGVVQVPSAGVVQNQPPSTGVVQNLPPSTGVVQNQPPSTGIIENQEPITRC